MTHKITLMLFSMLLGWKCACAEKPTLNQAKVLIASNKTSEAIPILEKLMLGNAQAPAHNYFLGMCLIKEGVRIGEAVGYLEKAGAAYATTDLDPGMGEPEFCWYYLVIGYSRLKECDRAMETYNRFVQVYSQGDPFYTREAMKWVELCHEPMRMAQEIKLRQPPSAPQASYLKDRLTNTHVDADEVVTREVNFTTSSILYGVQVGASISPTYTIAFEGLKNVGVYVDENKIYRYVIGNLSFRSQAEALLQEVRASGYPDAFIVDINQPATYGEEVMSLNKTNINPQLKGRVEFRVQIGAFAETLPKDLRKLYFEIDKLKEVRENDLTILTAGKFGSYQEAQAHRDLLQQQGISDAFVTAFNRKKRVPVKVALHYLNQHTPKDMVPQQRTRNQ